ncbi:hypothetical protein NR995_22965 [Streptomyces albus]|nr:hypothetical protein [Streptomyces albus]UVN57054.1 hypothetical protein NR995_22965 [Streptomyces albus]
MDGRDGAQVQVPVPAAPGARPTGCTVQAGGEHRVVGQVPGVEPDDRRSSGVQLGHHQIGDGVEPAGQHQDRHLSLLSR